MTRTELEKALRKLRKANRRRPTVEQSSRIIALAMALQNLDHPAAVVPARPVQVITHRPDQPLAIGPGRVVCANRLPWS